MITSLPLVHTITATYWMVQ
ncbi:hypothetical protein ACHAW6_001938 [Cyclotella cf. meneghiniana]